MRHPNALRGIRTIRTANRLHVWLAVIAFLVLLIGLGAGSSGLGILLVLSLAGLVLSITAIIMELVGVSRAARDIELFRAAMIALIVGLIASILSAFFEDSTVNTILDLVNALCSLVASIFILKGIIALAEIYERGDLVEEGHRLIWITVFVKVIGMISNVLSSVLPETASAPAIIIAVVVLLLGLIQLFLFLSCLKKVIAMLEADGTSSDGTDSDSDSST